MFKRSLSFLLPLALLAAAPLAAQAQTGGVGIGTATPAASAALDVTSTTRGFLPPRLTTTQRNAIASPAAGLTIFNTTTGTLNTWNGVKWTEAVVSSIPPAAITFAYTGSSQTYTVPAGVTALTVDLAGAAGGPTYRATTGQGLGGRVQATLAVTPGQVLTIQVGGAGGRNAGGYNGGGGASDDESGGGGASDIRIGGLALANRVLVAGGGGGAGDSGVGGAGGGLTGGTGGTANNNSGGTGGSQTAVGQGGLASYGLAGANGSGATGGAGSNYGGGGGGGYYGGGGGVSTSGGGGGSSYAGSGTSAVAHTQGYQGGNGYVQLLDSSPLASTAAPVLDASNFVNGIWAKNGSAIFPTVLASNVGIGTATPAAKLTVQPATSAEVGLRVTNGVADGTAVSGNIVLQTLTDTNSGFSFLGFNGSNASGETRYSTSKNRWRLGTDQRSSTDAFFLDTYDGTTNLRVLTANTTGNVGIGTSTPGQKLEVAGTVYSSTGGFRFPDNTVQTAAAITTASNGLTRTSNNLALGGTLTQATSIAQAGNTFSLTGGNVGIGTTTPAGLLTVQGTAPGTGAGGLDQQQLSVNTSAGIADQWQSFTAAVSGQLTQLDLGVSSPTNANGAPGTLSVYAGQGTGGTLLASQAIVYNAVYNSYQQYLLNTPVPVVAGQQYTYRFEAPTVRVGFAYQNDTNPYAGGQASYSAGVDFSFKTYVVQPVATSVLTALAGGNVGIGTASPSQPLEVAGTVFSSAGGFKFPDGTTQATAASTTPATTASNGLTKTGNNIALGGALTGTTTINQGSNAFSLTGTGNVGIGTATPTQKLDVVGNATVSGTTTLDGNVGIGTTSTATKLYVQADDNSTNPIATFQPQNQTQGVSLTYYGVRKTGTNPISDLTLDGKGATGNILLHTTTSTGNVGIGTVIPSAKLDVIGNVRASAFVTTSDQRFKQGIRDIGSALASVLALRGVRYTFRQAEFRQLNLPAGEQIGVLAQEVEKIYPELVSTDAQGFKAVNYAQLTPVLIEALKEQQAQIEALKTQNAALKAETTATTEAFEARLRRLEAGSTQAQR